MTTERRDDMPSRAARENAAACYGEAEVRDRFYNLTGIPLEAPTGAHAMTTTTPVTTCLDCTVLPPFSVALCHLHRAAPAMRAFTECVEAWASIPASTDWAEVRRQARALLAQIDEGRRQ